MDRRRDYQEEGLRIRASSYSEFFVQVGVGMVAGVSVNSTYLNLNPHSLTKHKDK